MIVDRPDRVQAQISIAHEGISRTDPDRIAVALMNNVIGGSGFSSRLTQRVRASSGLTYHVDSSFSMRRQPGPFAVSTSTRVDEARRVVDLVLTELERARALPPSAAELEDARALMIGRFVLGLETSAAVMETLVDLDVYGLPEDSLDTYRARIRATGADAVERMVRERLHPGRAAIVLVGPADRLVPQFRDLANCASMNRTATEMLSLAVGRTRVTADSIISVELKIVWRPFRATPRKMRSPGSIGAGRSS